MPTEKTKKRTEYYNASITYHIPDLKQQNNNNGDNFLLIQDALAEFGVVMDARNNFVTIKIDSDKYYKAKTRYAGRHEKMYNFQNNKIAVKGETIHYSDVLYMMSFMKNGDIIKELGMKPATYYRHKKKLLESSYYDIIDMSRINDKNYLKKAEFRYYDEEF